MIKVCKGEKKSQTQISLKLGILFLSVSLVCWNILSQETNHIVQGKERKFLCTRTAHAHWNIDTANAFDVCTLIFQYCNITFESNVKRKLTKKAVVNIYFNLKVSPISVIHVW